MEFLKNQGDGKMMESDETTYSEPELKEPEVLDIKHGLNFTKMPENYTIEEVLRENEKTEAGPA